MRPASQRGQSLVEVALFLPIFILIIAGVVEIGYYINHYLNLLDASRESARYGADLDPISNYNSAFNHHSASYDASATYDCNTTKEFYTVIACYAQQNMPEKLTPSNGYDDIVISAFTINSGAVQYRWPPDTNDTGWSMTGNQISLFPSSRVSGLVDPASPKQGFLLVEIFYRHRQVLALPFFTIFVPRDIGIAVYTIMPNPTAGTVD
jgi:Flp pilus assembly protein TadG